MNERLKELAVQAGMSHTLGCFWQSGDHNLERFAELVRADEREACAKLCDDWFAGTAAKSIRERGKPDPAFKHFINDKWSGIL